MQVQRRLGLCFILLIILFSFTTNALASCPRRLPGPPCVEYWRADAVFTGVASRVVKIPYDTYGPYFRTTVHFTIEESFKGVGGTGVVLDLHECGHSFKEGERYLVYAHRNPNNQQLSVRVGSTRTQPISEAAEDLKYLRGLASAEDGSRVFGKVAQFGFNIKRNDVIAEALKNIKVILEGTDHRQEVFTDSEGRYEFRRLPTGTYKIQAELPAHLSFPKHTIKTTGRECVPYDISPWTRGYIAGRVLDVNGKPLISVPVSIVPAGVSAEEMDAESKDKSVWPLAYTDDVGRFRFAQLPPGRYLLIINRTEFDRSRDRETFRHLPRLFYPGVSDVSGATVIVVGKDDEAREYDFRLP
jgi:hypothetical protein